MSEFHVWTLNELSSVTFLLALCTAVQTLAAVLCYYQSPLTRSRFLENMLEVMLLCHVIVLSLPMGELQLSHYSGLLVPAGYIRLRYAAGICVMLSAFSAALYSRNARQLFTAAAAFMTLPFAETAAGSFYVWFYIAELIFLLLRGVHICLLRYRVIKANISALSVKDAVDSLHTGVLFSEPDGFIALVNVQMQKLMNALTGRIWRSSTYFYERLVSGELMPGCRRTEYEGQVVCILPDETAWMFTGTEIKIKKKRYIQLAAADITQRWALTAELRRQEQLLIQRGEELREMIEGLQTLSRTRELQKAKLRAHDMLGQRLTMLLHNINSGQELDYHLLSTQLNNLPDDLKSGQSSVSPHEKLESLRLAFRTIGVQIHLDGGLPEDDISGNIFADIISESTVNAVRHGFASEIFVITEHSEGIWHMQIYDNGSVHLPHPLREGGGISGMRIKAESLGGSLHVTDHPRFILKVQLPGGQSDV